MMDLHELKKNALQIAAALACNVKTEKEEIAATIDYKDLENTKPLTVIPNPAAAATIPELPTAIFWHKWLSNVIFFLDSAKIQHNIKPVAFCTSCNNRVSKKFVKEFVEQFYKAFNILFNINDLKMIEKVHTQRTEQLAYMIDANDQIEAAFKLLDYYIFIVKKLTSVKYTTSLNLGVNVTVNALNKLLQYLQSVKPEKFSREKYLVLPKFSFSTEQNEKEFEIFKQNALNFTENLYLKLNNELNNE